MAGKVFFSVSMSLDGFIAPESLSELMGRQWVELQAWILPQRFFRENLKFGAGGEEGRDNDIVRETFERTGASVMGRRMFDEGEVGWPDPPPFGAPVFVLTHHGREPWVRQGGTTFTFVTDGIESVLEQARDAADRKDVRVAGGAKVVQQFVRAGLVDEWQIHLAPVLLGAGVRLFDHTDPKHVELESTRMIESPRVTHLRYRFVKEKTE